MDYYCEITDLTSTATGMLMTHFDVKRVSDGSIVEGNVTRHFNLTINDEEGNPVSETSQQKVNRYWAELQEYADRVLADVALVDQHFQSFRASVLGVTYPHQG